ncbi:hypothetical protein PR202_gb28271 [Eleusine coracana subsp. coracana]|uniref:Peptidase M3A/M3B catalytic domain-containing protein n=1 Tax=Eleusine coracana subsp. coracana TaxID=191504 RepID=A0AAV5FWV0_ELECO|nr:hypothetical protein PR202_gb28271 [Eleusine coracana subsp. coracana]
MLSRAAAIRRGAAVAFSTFTAKTETGLYGFDVLRTAKGFRRFVDEAIQRSDELVAYVAQMPPSAEIVRAMDEISNTVCTVIDSAELCRQTHSDREFVEEADKASMMIFEHLQYLNTNTTLYNAILKAESEGALLTEEAQRAATTLRVDFEKGGIHLSKDKLEHVNQLNLDIVQLGRKFNENVVNKPGFVDVYPASRVPRNIQHNFKPIYRFKPGSAEKQSNQMDTTRQQGLRIVTDSENLSAVLRSVSDEEVRKHIYMVGNSEPRENIGVLSELIGARDDFAKIMGCKSYADFAIRPNMAASADVEFKIIQNFKRKMCNEKSANLEPWDEDYFIGMMKSSALNLNSSGDLGFMYLDIYSRKGKYPGCAHFAVQGVRKLSDSNYQLPIVALVCNFSSSKGRTPRLSHGELETLFHEFGHALHSLLSRTDETTGDPIPEELVKALNASRNMFPATELQRQVFYSIMDLTLFGEQPSKPMDTVSTVADLKQKHTSWKHAEGTNWHARFTHLINYGAGYYSYLYARCFATTIWQQVCQEDPLSRSTGSTIRDKLLQHGGSKDPSTMLKDFAEPVLLFPSYYDLVISFEKAAQNVDAPARACKVQTAKWHGIVSASSVELGQKKETVEVPFTRVRTGRTRVSGSGRARAEPRWS